MLASSRPAIGDVETYRWSLRQRTQLLDAAVELLEIRVLRQRGRKLDVLHQLVGALTCFIPWIVWSRMDLMASQYAVSAARAAPPPRTGRVWLGTTYSGPSPRS